MLKKQHRFVPTFTDIHFPLKSTISNTDLPSSNHARIEQLGYPKVTSIADGDLAFVVDLLDTFITNVSKDIDEFEMQFKKEEAAQVQRIAHKLRTSFLLFSMEDLFEQSIFIERNEHISNPRIYTEYISGVRNIVQHVLAQKDAMSV